MELSKYTMLSEAALNKRKCDLVLKNAKIVDVFLEKIISADIGIIKDTIVGIGKYDGIIEKDLKGKFVTPGFFDAHLHMESTMVSPQQLLQNTIPFGTTSYIEDPHEAANVKGEEGIEYILQNTSKVPANVYIMLPSCVPALEFEDNGFEFGTLSLRKYIDNPRILGLGEVMDYQGVIESKPSIHDKLNMFSSKIIDGHAPSLSENQLTAYTLAGINTDHECTTFEYALMEISKGIHVHIREGSAAKNLDTIVKGIVKNKIPTGNFSFCTDDKHIEEIRRDGHINYCLKRAVELGLSPIKAIQMATINTARCYGLKKLGAIAPGYQADLVVLEDLKDFKVKEVYFKGKNTKSFDWENIPYFDNPTLTNSVNVKKVSPKQLEMKVNHSESIIEIVQGQILTTLIKSKLPEKNGIFAPNSEFNKIAIVERHKGSGLIGISAIKGFNIEKGAIASSVSHDSHNISLVGDNDEDMLLALSEITKNMGGFTIVSKGKILKTLPLPVMGLISDQNYDHVIKTLEEMNIIAHTLGVPSLVDPFVTLSFIALPVIPEIRITPRGLFDVINMKYI